MKKFLTISSVMFAALMFVAGCTKVDDLKVYDNGKAVTLSASKTSVSSTPADSLTEVISFSWTSPNYATDTNNYKFIVEIDSTGRNFTKSVTKEVIGKSRSSLTGKELNNIVLNYGFAVGTPYTLDVRVISSYANNNERYTSNTVKVQVTPYTDPSVLTSTATTVTGTLATATQNALTFSWTPSFNGYAGAVTYALQFDSSGKNFASPQEVAVGASIFSRAITQGEINTAALNEGVTGGTAGRIEYRVKATTAQGAIAYSNAVSILVNTYMPLLRFYMAGNFQGATGNGNDWDPPTAPEMIRDLRPAALNKLYYAYMYLPANTAFKFTQGRAWTTNYGGTGGNLSAGGADITVANAGFYRVSLDIANMKYDIRPAQMGFVGGATGAGWNPSAVFPNYAMGMPANNLFVGVSTFTVDGWKMIDFNDWNNGDISATNVRSYGSTGPSGSSLVVNSDNMPNPPSAGRYRVIWDGRDPNNIKYEMFAATEMRVVGDGMNQAGVNDWDPGSSPQMTYQGNGVWTITITLKANKDIKFLAGNAWGAFDYEDNSGGSQAVGTARKMKWEGGNNFRTPTTAGTYTITLNEHMQTVTIN